MFLLMYIDVSPHVYSCFFSICLQVSGPLPPGGNPIAVNIISYLLVSEFTHCMWLTLADDDVSELFVGSIFRGQL